MTEISEHLLCLYTSEFDDAGDTYTLEIPKREIEIGHIEPAETYQIALLESNSEFSIATNSTNSKSKQSHSTGHKPVTAGDVIDVEIETLGDQGDGIARIGPGYVIIVEDTEIGERVAVRITNAEENVGFGDVVKRYDH